MAVLFRPVIPVDNSHWAPALRTVLQDDDFRVWPDAGDAGDIHFLISWGLVPGDAVAWPNLKAVLSLGAGVNQFAGHPEFPKGAALIRMIDPDLTQGMVEYVTSFALRFHRRHDHLRDLSLRAESWDCVLPTLTRDRRVGIMGMGEMGQACARALNTLGFKVLGWSRHHKDIPGVTPFSGAGQMVDFLSQSEILVCLLPLTPETKGILNHDTLSRLPRGASIINAGRGKHLVEEDLIPLLDAGQIDQAALDVFHKEPLPADHPFWYHPRIHISPHLAAITIPESGTQTIKHAIDQINKGERPAGWVDIGQGY